MYILGLSFFYHDSSATLLRDGVVLGAVQEERFSRKKFDNGFPLQSIQFLLQLAQINIDDIDKIIYYENPLKKLVRIIRSFVATAPRNLSTFGQAMNLQLRYKLWIKRVIRRETNFRGKISYVDHHQSHAASAFYPSPFNEAAFLTLDGVGEWATTTFGQGNSRGLEFFGEIDFPHSLGLLYAAFTYFTGFKINSGEYKLMGLAPYGEPRYLQTILDNLIDLKSDGSFRINQDYFDYATGEKMINEKFCSLFKRQARKPESDLTQDDMDLARSIQEVTELAVLNIATRVKKETGQKNLCLAGGVALNCVANSRLSRTNLFENIWVQPAAGDAGGSLGAALYFWHQILGKPNLFKSSNYFFNPYLGPAYNKKVIREFLDSNYLPYSAINEIEETTARLLADGYIIGWFQGRMEFGPRALGNRSILGHPGLPDMQKKMNLKIKFRESFRPFAPAVLEERAKEWFQEAVPSPYMLFVFPVCQNKRVPEKNGEKKLFGIDKLNVLRSLVPAITHVDYSARIQTVNQKTNLRFYTLIKKFYELTGLPMIINTSFNVRNEPIVRTPEEAYRCFMRTNMDYLILEDFLLTKKEQPKKEERDWEKLYELD
ncbi:MAG: carbamoyltransferase [Patescibacteria group bacterium]